MKYLFRELNQLAAMIHNRSQRAGFYEPDKVRPFDGMLMNVITEVTEAQEEWRRGRGFNEYHWTVLEENLNAIAGLKYIGGKLHVRNYEYGFAGYDPKTDGPEWLLMTPELLRRMPNMVQHLKPEGIPSELADIIIRVLDMAAFFEIDIAQALADKMEFNETRPYRHGGKLS